ncbi:diaminopimelate epimerase [Candidatus Magnetoovum chiemensis]|nr:diaminopimelate epimerase [Candidatus Magnetoovum chiemensis]
MKINFVKMQGLGNDFLLIDSLEDTQVNSKDLKELNDNLWQSLSRRLCDRRFGIGADQILLLLNSNKADFKMRIFNADGSEVEMCGNGIRCIAKYVWDRNLSNNNILSIETLSGIIKPQRVDGLIKVDMGEPILDGKRIPVILEGQIIAYPLKINGQTFNITCVSMGNPHTVIVVDDVESFPVHEYGPVIEKHPFFPKRTNVEFIEIINRKEIKMRVWERGAGETLACGTGACAVCAAANIKNLCDNTVTIHIQGGTLTIAWHNDNHIYMTGPAVEVFTGSLTVE